MSEVQLDLFSQERPLPCPFCGRVPTIQHFDTIGDYEFHHMKVFCKEPCLLEMGYDGRDEAEFIKIWNSRP